MASMIFEGTMNEDEWAEKACLEDFQRAVCGFYNYSASFLPLH